jgi:predicted nicotinamide N-methyase
VPGLPALTMRINTDHAAFVRAHTGVGSVPMVPEIRLRLGEDAIGIWEQAEQELGEPDQQPPFWAFAWAGGQALARYILDHQAAVAGRTVLDLGSGSGLAAIAAALAGANSVLASELDPFAIAAIGLNAELNGVSVRTTGDVLDTEGGDADVVLAADIWYEKRLAARALGLLRRAAARGATVLLGDVGRAFLPRDQLRELASYDIPVLADLENAPVKRAKILTLRPDDAADPDASDPPAH